MTKAPTRQLLPDVDAAMTAMLETPPDASLVVDSITALVFARLPKREEHLRALILLGRALQARNVGDDVVVALERLEQALALAVAITANQPIKDAGWALATAYAHAGRFVEADEALARLRLLMPKGSRMRDEDRRWLERLTLKVQSIFNERPTT